MTWPSVKLGHIARVDSGFGFPREEQGHDGEEFPFFKVSDMNAPDNQVELRTSAHTVSRDALVRMSAKPFPAGTIVFPKIGAAIATEKKRLLVRPSAFDNNVMGVVPGSDLEPKFLYYWFQTVKLQELANIGPVPSIRKTTVTGLECPLPPLPDQRRIVAILDEADRLRKLRAEADAKAERILPALFIKMFGDPATNPKRWPTKTLGDLGVDFRYGTSQQCDSAVHGVPVLRIPNVVRGMIDTTDLKYTELSSDEKGRLLLNEGDVLFVRTNGNRDYVGRSAPFDLAGEYCFASYLIRARTSCLDPHFMSAYYSTPAGRRVLDPFIRTTAGQSNLNVDALKRLPIYLPDNQKEFAPLKKSLVSTLGDARIASERLDLLFSLLMQSAFSGKLTDCRERNITRALPETEIRP